MTEFLTKKCFEEIDLAKRNNYKFLKTVSNTPDTNEQGSLLESDLPNPSNIHERTKHSPV